MWPQGYKVQCTWKGQNVRAGGEYYAFDIGNSAALGFTEDSSIRTVFSVFKPCSSRMIADSGTFSDTARVRIDSGSLCLGPYALDFTAHKNPNLLDSRRQFADRGAPQCR